MMESISKSKKRKHCDLHSVETHKLKLAGQTIPEKKSQKLKVSSPAVCDSTFLEPDGLSDLTLSVQSKQLFTSKAVLAMVSPVFRSMFESGVKHEKRVELELPEKTFKDVLLLLRVVCHKVELRDLKTTEIVSLIHLADEYQMTILIKDCGKHLLDLTQHGNIPKIDLFFKVLDLTIRYSLDALRDDCVNYLTRNVDERIEDTVMYKTLSPEGKTLLLESTVQQIRYQAQTHQDMSIRLNQKLGKLQQIVHNHDNHCYCQLNNCNHYGDKTCRPLSNLRHSKVNRQYCARCLANIGHNVTEELMI